MADDSLEDVRRTIMDLELELCFAHTAYHEFGGTSDILRTLRAVLASNERFVGMGR